MKYDIGDLLNSWPFDPDEFIARRITARDGSEKIQIRIDMGMLQLAVEGRPDGHRPHGAESLLQHYRSSLPVRSSSRGGASRGDASRGDLGRNDINRGDINRSGGAELDEDACEDLFQEAWQYYQRYLALFYLEDYAGVTHDTGHNLAIFDLVQEYADSDEVKWYFEQYFPHAVMMQARAGAMEVLENKDYPAALRHVQKGIDRIEEFLGEWEGEGGDVMEEEFPELTFLRDWYEELEKERPLSPKEQLEHDLTVAVEAENFEEAARLRDKLRTLRPAFLNANPQRSGA
ncbi:MAG: UvrB/UvrC motif-containing protein [bacterium]|nr:UvrB/UvrC motif-containing protein [bacterium]